MKPFVLLAAGLALSASSGCRPEVAAEAQPPAPAFPEGTLDPAVVGTWTADGGKTVLRFDRDGKFGLKIDMTVDMKQGGGKQRVQRTDAGRWTTDEDNLYVQHSDGLVLKYPIVEESKADELHLRVPGNKKPTVYRRVAEKKA